MSDGKISKDEPLETLANILEAIIDIILREYRCQNRKTTYCLCDLSVV
ncbi:hypothetical protein [Clostridium sp. BNL1100]|nr:hypothetical protein [Clostridium sp. BNL1100]